MGDDPTPTGIVKAAAWPSRCFRCHGDISQGERIEKFSNGYWAHERDCAGAEAEL